jgi:two-component system, LytTR family, sensor histidine kinase AlgZ
MADKLAPTLPNFCNLGIALRAFVGAELMGLAAALVRAEALTGLPNEFLHVSAFMQPLILLSLVCLCALRSLLSRLPYRQGLGAVLLVVLLVTALVHVLIKRVFPAFAFAPLPDYWLLAAMGAATLLGYFHLRTKALSPAITEARLQALQSRIRPHFLFNSLNAVLSLIRNEPKRAEGALENLSDLFRALMRETGELCPLAEEVALTRAYLELEQLRLGDRLRVVWHDDKMPADAMIPPLILQPLVENAVYHGIEPLEAPGEIRIDIFQNRNRLHLIVRNPCRQSGPRQKGNRLAMDNIRQRLMLHFDAESELDTKMSGNTYQVRIGLPYVKK